jgi:hypothetical protein
MHLNSCSSTCRSDGMRRSRVKLIHVDREKRKIFTHGRVQRIAGLHARKAGKGTLSASLSDMPKKITQPCRCIKRCAGMSQALQLCEFMGRAPCFVASFQTLAIAPGWAVLYAVTGHGAGPMYSGPAWGQSNSATVMGRGQSPREEGWGCHERKD